MGNIRPVFCIGHLHRLPSGGGIYLKRLGFDEVTVIDSGGRVFWNTMYRPMLCSKGWLLITVRLA